MKSHKIPSEATYYFSLYLIQEVFTIFEKARNIFLLLKLVRTWLRYGFKSLWYFGYCFNRIIHYKIGCPLFCEVFLFQACILSSNPMIIYCPAFIVLNWHIHPSQDCEVSANVWRAFVSLHIIGDLWLNPYSGARSWLALQTRLVRDVNNGKVIKYHETIPETNLLALIVHKLICSWLNQNY